MKFLFILFLFLFTSYTQAATSMNQEGQCSGTLQDGTTVSFTHYSNYDGCRKVSDAAISFTAGLSGLLTGNRSFTSTQDRYNFGQVKLNFANSTDITTGTLKYVDESAQSVTIPLQCEIRIYEYALDCE